MWLAVNEDGLCVLDYAMVRLVEGAVYCKRRHHSCLLYTKQDEGVMGILSKTLRFPFTSAECPMFLLAVLVKKPT